MVEEILISISPREDRVAVIEGGLLQEVYIEQAKKLGLVGNIYKGKVARVMPGMQAAFIDIGLERTGFLHASDMVEAKTSDDPKKLNEITELIKEEDEVIVQVAKDTIGSKGVRLTTNLSIPSRYLVYMPSLDHLGVSQKIDSEEEQTRLRELLSSEADGLEAGYIIRTVAEGAKSFKSDINYLKKLWVKVQTKIKNAKVGDIIHEDLRLPFRAIRDLVSEDTLAIKVDDKIIYQQLLTFIEEFIPIFKEKLILHDEDRFLFDLYNIEDEIQKALKCKIDLKSGGYVIFDQTEAMTTVDVNTGGFLGTRNLEETVFKTNLEAATIIARQIRLRNLGGIIIVDFIDMIEEEHQNELVRIFEKAISKDYAKISITGLSSLGLIEMSRKRTRESLERTLCQPCPLCESRGSIKSAETVCYEIFREILRVAQYCESHGVLVLVSPGVADYILDNEMKTVSEIEDRLNKAIEFQVESLYTPENYDVVML